GVAIGRWTASPAGDARPALARAEEAVRQKDWQSAHDALLAALRVSPGSQEVFDAGCRFVEAAADDGEDAALLAEAVHQRPDAAAYGRRKARHEACQKSLAADLFRATLVETRRIDGWRERVGEFIKQCDRAEPPEPKKMDADAARLAGEGQKLLRELVTFQDA